MGGAVSSQRVQEPTEAELNALAAPYSKKDGELCFICIPQDLETKRKHELVVLEISPDGMRVLRHGTDDCISFHSWGSLHSWSAASANKFVYRFWDDLAKCVQQSSVFLREVDISRLLDQVQTVVQGILDGRRNGNMTDAEFVKLIERVREEITTGGDPAAVLAATAPKFLWSNQGRILLEVLPNSFDKVEVAVQLHHRLIDQNRFTTMLDVLHCQADRDNVWHRVTVQRKKLQGASTNSSKSLHHSTTLDG